MNNKVEEVISGIGHQADKALALQSTYRERIMTKSKKFGNTEIS
jgi:hypothetical protein